LIADVIAGFEITPHELTEGGHTREIDREKLSYEIAIANKHFRGTATRPAPYQAAPDARGRIDAALHAQSAAEQRSRLLKQWGFREDREVHPRPGYAGRLMGAPRIR
jgi:hypothetical protein